MQNSLRRSRYETAIATLDRAILAASREADRLDDEGAVEDLTGMRLWTRAVLEASLAGRRRPALPGQLTLTDHDMLK